MNKKVALIFSAIIAVVVLLGYQCKPKKTDEKAEETKLLYKNHHDTVKYVGKEACRSCHSDKFNTFIHTGMGESFGIATKDKSAAEFNHAPVYDKFRDFYYKPHWEGSDLYLLEFRLDGRDTVYRRNEKINYIVGSGQHTNSHIIETNGYLTQAPLTWYAQQKRWDLPPGFEDGHNTRFSRIIGLECMSCHNALPGFVQGSENRFDRIPDGISCERCHGPGELHIKEKSAGIIIDTANETDYTIVNPRKLPWDLQIDACQRCHLQGNAVLKDGKTFFDFRPGMRLSDVMEIFMPKYEGRGEDEFIMASHAQRLQMSQCFTQSNKGTEQNAKAMKLTCITCHDPHVSVKVTGKEVFNNACKGCHAPTACKEDTHVRLKVSDNCSGCHMPLSGTIDIPHVSVHDHYIRKPEKVIDNYATEVKKFIGIYSVNNPKSDDLTKGRAYLSYFEKFETRNLSLLDSAKFYLDKAKAPAKDYIHLAYLKSDYNSVISYAAKTGNDMDDWTAYRIGQTYYNQAKYADAERYLQTAVSLAPFNIDFRSQLAATLLFENKTTEAQQMLEALLKDYPKHTQALTNLGYIYFTQNKLAEANQYYDKALALDPDYEPALLNKVGLYNYLKDYDKSRKLLARILKRDPNNYKAKQILEQLRGM